MEDQYGMADLRQYMNGRSMFPAIPTSQDLLSGHRSLTAAQHYDMVMVGRQGSDMVHHQGLHQDFHSDSTTSATNTSVIIGGASSGGFSGGGLEMDASGLAADVGTGRWPRQETLTLLEIRSRLDSKFKEANQKGPLWDEVSRIMSEEHGYQRSGKKCREKFENLYKYYKKTKEGKAGRQDGKHYRFFRQLEALYGGETSNAGSASEPHHHHHHLAGSSSFRYNAAAAAPNNINHPGEPFQTTSKPSDSLSLSNSSDFETTSSDDSDLNATMDNDSTGKRKKRSKRGWKVKIKEFIDGQMRKLMEKQEAWLEKMMKTIEHKEFERMLREEEWRKQEEARIDKEHKFWAKERAWIEARDAALVEALQKLTGKDFRPLAASDHQDVLATDQIRNLNEKQNENAAETTISNTVHQGEHHSWQESETSRLIQLRTSMEPRFQQVGCPEILWKEIAAKMASFGYDRSPLMCQDKWDSINDYLIKCKKKGKENSANSFYFQGNESICHQVGAYCDANDQAPGLRRALDEHSTSPPNCSTGQNINDSCFRYLMGTDAENLWDNYPVKICKGDN